MAKQSLDLLCLRDLPGLVEAVYLHMCLGSYIGECADETRTARHEALQEDVGNAGEGRELGVRDGRCQSVELADGSARQLRPDDVRVLRQLADVDSAWQVAHEHADLVGAGLWGELDVRPLWSCARLF